MQARIVMGEVKHTDKELYDVVIGCRGGDWVYEWTEQAMDWQQKASMEKDPQVGGHHWLHAFTLYNIATYPRLKGDGLAEQAQALADRAYEKAAQRLPGTLHGMEFAAIDGAPITDFLRMPKSDSPFPTALMCDGLDSMQTDYYSLYERYFAPRSIAMLTLDMPSIKFSSKWKLTQDSSLLHQRVLKALPNVPWVDHIHVAAFSFRFSASVAVRLAYLESSRLKAAACLGLMVRALLNDPQHQASVPEMYLDILANRLGMRGVSDKALRVGPNRYSLEMQDLLERRCPTPVLSGFQRNDPFSPEEESRLITSSSSDSKLLKIPPNPMYRNFDRGPQEITGWINQRLC